MSDKTLEKQGKAIRSFNGWFSLNRLLELYSPGVLATAVEGHGVFVIDRLARPIQADLEGQSDYSRTKALDLLADRQAEIEDPRPGSPSWNSERYDTEPHPLDRFGWPEDALPNLDEVERKGPLQKAIPWRQRPLSEFEQEIEKAGSQTKAAAIHGVRRQTYSAAYNKKKAGKVPNK